jgi:hypothetical protein
VVLRQKQAVSSAETEGIQTGMITQKQKVSTFNGIKRVASKDAASSSGTVASSVLLAARADEGALGEVQNEDSATQGEYSPSQGARLMSSTILAEQDSVDFAHKVGEYVRTGKKDALTAERKPAASANDSMVSEDFAFNVSQTVSQGVIPEELSRELSKDLEKRGGSKESFLNDKSIPVELDEQSVDEGGVIQAEQHSTSSAPRTVPAAAAQEREDTCIPTSTKQQNRPITNRSDESRESGKKGLKGDTSGPERQLLPVSRLS